MTFAFPKKQHLAQREAVTALASGGKVLFKHPIKAYCLPTGDIGYPRYVFSVPKKLFKRAVKRNLLKRRMREAVRLNQEAVLGGLCADFLLVYIGKDVCTYEVIEAAVKDILAKSREVQAKGREITAEPGKPAKTEPRP
ncbi:MAG: ribonuclease P protein component [Bacteroidales bacterium]|nr:ribonuclease P protein component [Bacteroidales bacterium]